MKNSQITILIVAILIVAGVGAYLVTNDNDYSKNGDKTIPDSDYYPITITVTVGGIDYEQIFTESPKRILAMWNANVELLCYFGLEDRIVGAYANESYDALFDELQSKYDAVEKMPTNTSSIEMVRSLDPDLILGWASTFTDSYLGNVPMWNGYGTNCFISNRPSTTVDDYLGMLEKIGTIFNMKAVADQKISDFTSAYDTIAKKTSSMTDGEKVKALMIEPGYETGCFVYGSEFLSGDLITKAGGINMFDGAMSQLTFEQIAAYDPDIIFIMSGSGSSPLALQEALNKFKAVPGFASMTDNLVPFGFYELYMGGLLPDDIINRMFEAMYSE